jgi:hypothetical protein
VPVQFVDVRKEILDMAATQHLVRWRYAHVWACLIDDDCVGREADARNVGATTTCAMADGAGCSPNDCA